MYFYLNFKIWLFLNDQYSNVGEALTNKVSKCFSKQKVETVCSMSV